MADAWKASKCVSLLALHYIKTLCLICRFVCGTQQKHTTLVVPWKVKTYNSDADYSSRSACCFYGWSNSTRYCQNTRNLLLIVQVCHSIGLVVCRYLFRAGTRQRGGDLCSATLIPPLSTRSTGTYHGYASLSRYRFYRGFGDLSMPTPRTGVRQPARAPSLFLCDHDAVTLVRSGQPTVWA